MDTAKLFPHHNTILDPSKRRVLSFGEQPEAFSELQITDTLCPISRGYIQLSGPDSCKFLQGQVTCDMQAVNGHQVLRGAHCTPSLDGEQEAWSARASCGPWPSLKASARQVPK